MLTAHATPPVACVIQVDDSNFEDEVARSPLPVLVDVSTRWCGPCRVAAPVVAELAKKHAGVLKVVEIDGDDSAALVARLGVRGFPTFLGFVAGEIAERRAGFAGRRALEQLAASLLGPSTG
jgi:thioredoxin-like negative regulator of GroEL